MKGDWVKLNIILDDITFKMASPLIYGITREQISYIFLGQKERKYHVDIILLPKDLLYKDITRELHVYDT
jgi:hypothetical protein